MLILAGVEAASVQTGLELDRGPGDVRTGTYCRWLAGSRVRQTELMQ